MTKRSHFKQTEPLADRLEHFAKAMREKAATLPTDSERKAALAKATEAETTAQMDRWISARNQNRPRAECDGPATRADPFRWAPSPTPASRT